MGQWFDLADGWTLRAVDDSPVLPADIAPALRNGVPGAVPGCVHTDLLSAGLIPDPYLDRNEADLRWIGRCDWRYDSSFSWPSHATGDVPLGADERVDLVCDGLDTFATIELNRRTVGTTQNMHRSYRFPVNDLLRGAGDQGSNQFAIIFSSAVRRARELRDELGDLPRPDSIIPEPYNFVRKMACNFGWDWGPELVTAGISKPVRLHRWSVARLAGVCPIVSVEESGGNLTGRVRVDVELERTGSSRDVTVTAQLAEEHRSVTVAGQDVAATIELNVKNPELWWPHGFGPQPLSDLEITLEANGRQLDTWSRRIGFRNVALDTKSDDIGSAFTLVVNDTPIFIRGANWIPDDCFPARLDAERYRNRIEQAKEANINLLRVWGGGLYETAEFYDACDELGILVWQDFAFACAAYPEKLLRDEVEAEARENVTRLMPHPSLVLWCGNNENIWGWFDWSWQDQLGDRSWGLGYYLDLLATVTAEIDPSRPYWPGSPYSGSMDTHPNADEHGCTHVWDVWNERDYTAYRDHVPRFVAEFGYQGPPTWATLRRAISDEAITPDSPGMLSHQKAEDGHAKLARGLATHFPQPNTVADWHFATQLNQARAITLGIEHFRSHRGRCMGTVIWQLNDCWPVISWSAVDGDGRRKPMWYALRRAYADRLLTFQPHGDGLVVVAINDGHAPWRQCLTVERRRFDGTVIATWEHDLVVAAQQTVTCPLPADVRTPGDPAGELLVLSAGQGRATWFFSPDKNLDYPEPSYDISTEQTGADLLVHVAAHTLLRDVAIFADRLDPSAEVDDMLVTLLPGETHVFRLRGVPDSAMARLSDPLVIRTANDLINASTWPTSRQPILADSSSPD